jgi:cellobiose phosphorylase
MRSERILGNDKLPPTLVNSPALTCDLFDELHSLRRLVVESEDRIRHGFRCRLPGNAAFFEDGRVLCRERKAGDSRYPYGTDGFNFWVNASGAMSGNRGLYFLFLPTVTGQDPPIAFFCGLQTQDGHGFRSHGLLPIPFVIEGESRVVDRYTVIGHDATYFITETPELLTVVRVFVDQSRGQRADINFSLLTQNVSSDAQAMFTSAYFNPFCRHQFVETNEDRWFKRISVDSSIQPSVGFGDESEAALPPFEITTNEDISRFHSRTNHALIRRAVRVGGAIDQRTRLLLNGFSRGSKAGDIAIATQVCTSRAAYLGSPRRSLNSAEFLTNGQLQREVSTTVFSENAIVGDLLRLDLPPSSYFRADYVFSSPETSDEHNIDIHRGLCRRNVDASLQAVRREVTRKGNLEIAIHDSLKSKLDANTFNHFLPFLKKQVAACALLEGYMQPSANSLIGFRDVLQAIDAYLFDQPLAARAKILETLGFVMPDGRCPRQYSLAIDGDSVRADLREFIDQGVWAIATVHNYLAVTGESDLLEEEIGYHTPMPNDDSQLVAAMERDSVLEHLFRIMNYLADKRDPATELVLALYGDWNDAVDGLGISNDPAKRFGTGVSVTTSLQLYQCCTEMLAILDTYVPNQYENQANSYRQLQQQLRDGLLKYAVVCKGSSRKISHGWGDQQSYFVGSFWDSDGRARDSLTSHAFWVLSDMLDEDPSLRSEVLAAFERLDSPYGLKTFEPGFAPSAPGIGRITKLPIGTAENGAAYVHATTFGIAALFKMGEPQRAWEQILKILPFTDHHKEISHSPYVIPNSYIRNLQLNLDGQSMNDWQTGSSNMLLKLLIRYAFGFRPRLNHLLICPAMWQPTSSFELDAVAHGRPVHLTYSVGGSLDRRVSVNGEEFQLLTLDRTSGTLNAEVSYDLLSSSRVNNISVQDPSDNRRP